LFDLTPGVCFREAFEPAHRLPGSPRRIGLERRCHRFLSDPLPNAVPRRPQRVIEVATRIETSGQGLASGASSSPLLRKLPVEINENVIDRGMIFNEVDDLFP